MTWVHVLVYALITALATGLGALPFYFVKNPGRNWLGLGTAAAAGLMLAASIGLAVEGVRNSIAATGFGLLVGVIFIIISKNLLERGSRMGGSDDGHDHDDEGGHHHHHALPTSALGSGGIATTRGLLLILVMTAHSFAEGAGVGVAFGGGQTLGLLITIAIAVHNIPEGLAISLVMVPRGTSPTRAVLWSIFTSLPQPLIAVPAFLFVQLFELALPAGLGFAAGAMLWMCFYDLIPDSVTHVSRRAAAATVVLSAGAMGLLQLLLNHA